MTMSPEDKQKILEKINEKINEGRLICICKHSNFTLVDGLVNLPLTDKISGNLVIGGPTLPNAVIVCTYCGYTFFFNLVVLGVLKDEQK